MGKKYLVYYSSYCSRACQHRDHKDWLELSDEELENIEKTLIDRGLASCACEVYDDDHTVIDGSDQDSCGEYAVWVEAIYPPTFEGMSEAYIKGDLSYLYDQSQVFENLDDPKDHLMFSVLFKQDLNDEKMSRLEYRLDEIIDNLHPEGEDYVLADPDEEAAE